MTDAARRSDPEHVSVYLRLKAVLGTARESRDARRRATAAEEGRSIPFEGGRDPRGISSVLDEVSARMGWQSPLARSELLAGWGEIVGADVAAHAVPVGIEEGVLTVRCSSSAWAQQMRSMRGRVLSNVIERHPDAEIDSVRFIGPDAPSWKRGHRAIQGRGPRDTYG